MPHLVQMHKEFGSKGLAVVAISLDNDKNKAKKFIKEKGMNWYNICDGNGWKAQLYVGHGWNSIPQKFLLDPEGKVVAMRDDFMTEEGLRKKMKEVFKKTPPTRTDNPMAGDGAAELAAAEKDFEAKEYAKALKAYEKVAKEYKSKPAGKTAAEMVAKIKGDKKIYGEIVAADAEKNAPKLIKMAEQLAEQGKADSARKYYQQVVDKYPGTKYAERAREAIDKL